MINDLIIIAIFAFINIGFVFYIEWIRSSSKRKAEEELNEKTRALIVSSNLNKIILESLDFKEVVQKIADAVPHELYFGTGVVAVIDENKKTIKRIAASRTKEAMEAIKELKVPFEQIEISLDDPHNLMARALREKKSFASEDVYDVLGPVINKEESKKIQNIMGTKTTLVYPIYGTKDKAIGVFIASTSKTGEEITEYEYDMIGNFVDGVGIALYHALLYTQVTERNKTLSLLREIDEIILGSVTDIQQVTQRVANLLTTETNFIKAAVIITLDKEKEILTRIAISQSDSIRKAEQITSKPFQGIETPMAFQRNLVVQVVNEKTVKTTESLYEILIPHFTPEESKRLQEVAGIKCSLVYPLIVRDQVIGATVISIAEDQKALSEYQRDLLERLVLVIGIAIDNAQLYQQIQAANEKLKELDKLKDEFLSIASHELRTPMTIIKSYLWLVINEENENLKDKQKLYLNRVYSSTDRLIDLVNDLLNISRIESGRLILDIKPVDIQKLIQEIITEMSPRAQETKVNLSFEAPAETLPNTLADYTKVKEVLINLVSNAFKFTPEGGKIIISSSTKDGKVIVKVSDTGNGISKKDFPKLFQKFGLVGNASLTKLNSQGTGLGLYICKSLIELQGGEIWVESEGLNKGAVFAFSLKVAE